MPNMSVAKQWEAAEKFVADNADAIRAAVTQRSPKQLYDLAKDADITSLWPKIVTELDKQLDIDYRTFKAEVTAERREKLLAAVGENAPVIELYTAGDAEVNSYAICDTEGAALWYGAFFEKEKAHGQDDAHAAGSAIEKALFLAGEARKKGPDGESVDGVAVTIVHSHPDPTPSLQALETRAVNAGLLVRFVHSEQNPAMEWCRENGYRNWREVKLQNLFTTTPTLDEGAAEAEADAAVEDAEVPA